MDFKEIVEPLRDLFKDEVRAAGRELGLPEYLVCRQPFPGPGLAIRIIGEVTAEKVAIVQDADAIFREEIAKLPAWTSDPSQYFAALTNMRSRRRYGRRAHLRLRHRPARRDHHRLHDGRGHASCPPRPSPPPPTASSTRSRTSTASCYDYHLQAPGNHRVGIISEARKSLI